VFVVNSFHLCVTVCIIPKVYYKKAAKLYTSRDQTMSGLTIISVSTLNASIFVAFYQKLANLTYKVFEDCHHSRQQNQYQAELQSMDTCLKMAL